MQLFTPRSSTQKKIFLGFCYATVIVAVGGIAGLAVGLKVSAAAGVGSGLAASLITGVGLLCYAKKSGDSNNAAKAITCNSPPQPTAQGEPPVRPNLHVTTNSIGSMGVPEIEVRNSASLNMAIAVPITPAADNTHTHVRVSSIATPIAQSLASFGLSGFDTPLPAAGEYTYATVPQSVLGLRPS